MTTITDQTPRDRTLPRVALAAVAILLVLAVIPSFSALYQVQLLTYGLIAAIAALGFNLLLGYTGLLSFGNIEPIVKSR